MRAVALGNGSGKLRAALIVDLQPELNLAVLKKRTGNRPKRSGVEKPVWLV